MVDSIPRASFTKRTPLSACEARHRCGGALEADCATYSLPPLVWMAQTRTCRSSTRNSTGRCPIQRAPGSE